MYALPKLRLECVRLSSETSELFDFLIAVVAFLLGRLGLREGEDMMHWDAVICFVLILVFFFGITFSPQIANYLNAKIEGIRLKKQREGALKQKYRDGYNKGYKDGLRDRLRRRKGDKRD
jgi:hypothetical protein